MSGTLQLPVDPRVVGYVSVGLSNRQIAGLLGVPENRIKWHLQQAYVRLGVSGRTELAFRYRDGVISV